MQRALDSVPQESQSSKQSSKGLVYWLHEVPKIEPVVVAARLVDTFDLTTCYLITSVKVEGEQVVSDKKTEDSLLPRIDSPAEQVQEMKKKTNACQQMETLIRTYLKR